MIIWRGANARLRDDARTFPPIPASKPRRLSAGPDVRNLLLIAIVWVATILLVNSSGDFPLNDDWAYGWTVKTLVDTGRYQLSDWTATNLLSQSLWGALFCLPVPNREAARNVVVRRMDACDHVPWLLAGGAAPRWRRSTRAKAATAGLVVLVGVIAADYVLNGKRMPLATNVLEPFSVGPQTLDGYADAYYANISEETKSVIGHLWTVLTMAGFAAAAVLVVSLIFTAVDVIRTRNAPMQRWLVMLTLVTSFIYFGAIGGLDRHYWYDRYLLPLLPLVLVSLAASSSIDMNRGRGVGLITAILVLTLYGGFAAAATHDYLSWNRTRWQALNALVARGVPVERIFGGFEFNGWHFGQKLDTCNASVARRSGPIEPAEFECLWGSDRGGFRYEYRAAFTPAPPGYRIAERHSFRRWLPWSIQPLYVLRRSQ